MTALAELRDRLRRGLPVDDVADEVVLVVNELATNAVLHGDPPVVVQVIVDHHVVRVEVRDQHPQMRRPREDSRGLMLIDRVAPACGVSYDDDGKVVWAEIPLRLIEGEVRPA